MSAEQQNPKEIRLTNCSPDLKKDLNNIAENMGVSLGPFLKMKLRELANSYPAEMRLKKKDY